MADQHKRQYGHPKKEQSQDPVTAFLDGLFDFLWKLVSAPFQDKNRAAEKERRRQEFQRQWTVLEGMAAMGDWRGAIMKADIMLDQALINARVPGQTLGERLKSITNQLDRPMLDRAWSAHKVRNRLAHELDYHPTDTEAKQTLNDFKAVLHRLEAL